MTETGPIEDDEEEIPTGRLIPEAVELLETFNRRTRDRSALIYPADASKHVGQLQELFRLLAPALNQLEAALDEHRRTLPLYTDNVTTMTVDEVYGDLKPLLIGAAALAGQADIKLTRAYALSNRLGVHDEPEEDEQ